MFQSLVTPCHVSHRALSATLLCECSARLHPLCRSMVVSQLGSSSDCPNCTHSLFNVSSWHALEKLGWWSKRRRWCNLRVFQLKKTGILDDQGAPRHVPRVQSLPLNSLHHLRKVISISEVGQIIMLPTAARIR